MRAELNTGDRVRLASGSPTMTVAYGIETEDGFAYLCQWVDASGIPQQEIYLEGMLVLFD
ncbi:DUF2158 domain-containing protein [Trinickia symbiotica]|uniref:DUF2158 domain-containing protein n=1 Tax=Trinickia symbiotica TaxID=863227 RepID=A0A2T3XMX1_9BURK|nr:DUF2158 domain-containing protein [Trinickia symbiotica]PTB17866.1 DUF2158 domain-containing protein [Trinickia symbiotica]